MARHTPTSRKRAGCGTKGTTNGRTSTSTAVEATEGQHLDLVHINRTVSNIKLVGLPVGPARSHINYVYCEIYLWWCVILMFFIFILFCYVLHEYNLLLYHILNVLYMLPAVTPYNADDATSWFILFNYHSCSSTRMPKSYTSRILKFPLRQEFSRGTP